VTPGPLRPPRLEARLRVSVARRDRESGVVSAFAGLSAGVSPLGVEQSPPFSPDYVFTRCPTLCPTPNKPPDTGAREMGAVGIEPKQRPLPLRGALSSPLISRRRRAAMIRAAPATRPRRLGLHLRSALDLQVGQTRSSQRGIHHLRSPISSHPCWISQHNPVPFDGHRHRQKNDAELLERSGCRWITKLKRREHDHTAAARIGLPG